MKNEKLMIKWLNDLKSDIGQPQHSQLWHYAEILDVIAKYLESTERTGKWIDYYQDGIGHFVGTCSVCGNRNDIPPITAAHYCPSCGARMK